MPTAAFVDVAFLKKEGAKALGKPDHETRIDAARVVGWIRNQTWGRFLRAYWYDGAFAPQHPQAAAQRRYFEAIALTPGIQIRLGHIAERRSPVRSGVRRAVADAAKDLDVDPAGLLSAFDKRWKFHPVRQQKG